MRRGRGEFQADWWQPGRGGRREAGEGGRQGRVPGRLVGGRRGRETGWATTEHSEEECGEEGRQGMEVGEREDRRGRWSLMTDSKPLGS